MSKVNKKIGLKFQELKNEYNKLLDEFKWNELIYNSKFSFEPVVGETYYLYIWIVLKNIFYRLYILILGTKILLENLL